MNRLPEPALLPREPAPPVLRCCICLRTVNEALEVPYGIVCRPCLEKQTLDRLSALLCAPILTNQGGTEP